MHSKAPYKICICSVMLGELEPSRNYSGFSMIFPMQHFRCNLTFNESENFSDSSLHDLFESENVRFPFSVKHSLTWGVKYEKLNFRKP